MKRFLLSVLMGLALLWSCSAAFAQTEGKVPGGENKPTRTARRIGRGNVQIDPNQVPRRVGAKRVPNIGRERMPELQGKQREQLLKMREIRQKKIGKATGGRDAGLPGDEPGAGTAYQQRAKALETQIAHEKAKNMRRIARLNRIKKLASEESSKEILTRIQALIQKEQLRYTRKHERMQMRKRTLLRIQERRGNMQPLDKRRLREETRRAIEKRASMRKSRGENGKKGAGKRGEQ
jgi:hypothetical protein